MDPLEYHRRNRGKISVEGKVEVASEEDMSLAYTPGVAEPSRAIADDPGTVYDYTTKGEMVGILTDGSAVLGLGDIGPEASIPVMEGKALLIREFGGVSAFPVVVDEEDTDALIATGERLHPMFGFLMLEDIASPACFRVEEELQDRLSIPVFHDDQHGAAVAVLAGLRNALDVAGKDLDGARVAVIGAGAAGIATADLLLEADADVTVVDRPGIIHGGMSDLNEYQRDLAARANPDRVGGDLSDALAGADAMVGLATGGIVSREDVERMADDPVVFALSNPDPEIPYDDAVAAGAVVAGTGRSDYPNQINNSIAFPGIVRGALDARATDVTPGMKLAAAEAIAAHVDPEPERVVPSALDHDLHDRVAEAVADAARDEGVCR